MFIKCEVLSVNSLSSNAYRVVLKPDHDIEYKAGQYLQVIMGENDKRPFSIVSYPNKQKKQQLELHIGAADKNAYAFEVVKMAIETWQKKDNSFVIEAPFGEAWLREKTERPLVLIAGGTGFSYVRSILDYAISQEFSHPIFLYWGGRDLEQLYANDEMKMLELKHHLLTYIPVLENAPEQWTGKIGNVLEAVMDDFVSLSDYDIYIAGRFEMSGIAREMFCNERGAAKDHLFSDAFAFL